MSVSKFPRKCEIIYYTLACLSISLFPMVPVVELWGVPASTSTATAMLFGGNGGRRKEWPRAYENRVAKE